MAHSTSTTSSDEEDLEWGSRSFGLWFEDSFNCSISFFAAQYLHLPPPTLNLLGTFNIPFKLVGVNKQNVLFEFWEGVQDTKPNSPVLRSFRV